MAREMKTYFILSRATRTIKIGKSVNPEERLKSLQTANSDELELVLVLPHRAPFEEDQLHYRFESFRVKGEWYTYVGALREFVWDKQKDPNPNKEDDLALAPKEDEDGALKRSGYAYPKHDNKMEHPSQEISWNDDHRPPMRSPGYGALPWWGARSDSQDYWHYRIHRQDA